MTAATRNITMMMLKDSQKQPPNSCSSQPQQTATGHQAQTAVSKTTSMKLLAILSHCSSWFCLTPHSTCHPPHPDILCIE